MECGPPLVLLPGPGGVSGKLPRARIMSYLPCSPSLLRPPSPGPWALVISIQLERESDPGLIVRSVGLLWPQGGKVGQATAEAFGWCGLGRDWGGHGLGPRG